MNEKSSPRYSLPSFRAAHILDRAWCCAFVFLFVMLFGPTARAQSIEFDQVNWGNGAGGFEEQNSDWGAVTIGLGAGDVGLLTADGAGGFFGYVNVVTSVAGGSNNNWAVQNLVVYYDSLGSLGGSLATSANFNLGNPDGVNVTNLNYSLTISAAPLSLQPGGPLTSTSVGDELIVAGTEDNPNDFGDPATQPATDYVGAPAATGVGARGAIRGSETNVPAINESVNGCAPGAAARSIVYMSRQGAFGITSTPQQIFGGLTNSMQTTTNAGTSGANLISGKNSYVASNGFPIATTFFTNSFARAINSLNSTGDVELGITWGFSISNTMAGPVTNFYGGHAVFVSQIIPITNATGQIVRYQIRYIEDTIQGDGIASNNVRTMTVLPNGADVNTPAGVQGRGAFGFFIENLQAVPEPSVLVLSALGVAVLAMLRRRRRC